MVATARAKTAIAFEPLHDFVLIRKNPTGTTPGGIELPDGSQVDPPTGVVMKVGPHVGTEEKPAQVAPGDVVYMMFQSYAPPVPITLSGQEYFLVHATEIIGKRT